MEFQDFKYKHDFRVFLLIGIFILIREMSKMPTGKEGEALTPYIGIGVFLLITLAYQTIKFFILSKKEERPTKN